MNDKKTSVRTLTMLALLVAMSIVFSRVLSISTGFVRFNLGSLPVLLAGILFGPWAGFVVGMVADIIGGVLSSLLGKIPVLGSVLSALISLLLLAYTLFGIITAGSGKAKELPFIGGLMHVFDK